ncbi:hypothetical protein BKA93DRAFT_463091 [Sparassis latifolia]
MPNIQYWLSRAAVCMELGAYAHAEADAKVAYIRTRKQSAEALFRLGQARRFLGRLAEAECNLKDALGIEPGNKLFTITQSLLMGSDENLQEWLAQNKGIDRPLPDISKEDIRKRAADMYEQCQPEGWQMGLIRSERIALNYAIG